jgi:hypothetical protein
VSSELWFVRAYHISLTSLSLQATSQLAHGSFSWFPSRKQVRRDKSIVIAAIVETTLTMQVVLPAEM